MSYKLSDAIIDAYQRNWSMVNTFTVEIHTPKYLTNMGINFNESINLNIKTISTPDFTNNPIEAFIANRWIIQNGADSRYTFNITFQDQDQMTLYKKFMKLYILTKENYFDDVALTIIVNKDADWNAEDDKQFIVLSGSLIESISNVQFSNDTENQIAEFTVNFKCNNPTMG